MVSISTMLSIRHLVQCGHPYSTGVTTVSIKYILCTLHYFHRGCLKPDGTADGTATNNYLGQDSRRNSKN